jgi:hypothetical protein
LLNKLKKSSFDLKTEETGRLHAKFGNMGLYIKVKLSRYRHAGAKEDRKFTHFFTSALDGVSGQRHEPAAL